MASILRLEPTPESLQLLDAKKKMPKRTGNGANRQNARNGWQRLQSSVPSNLYLRRGFLIGMAILFVSFIIALEILNFLSNRDQGFVSAALGNHYLWTYGPVFGKFREFCALLLARNGICLTECSSQRSCWCLGSARAPSSTSFALDGAPTTTPSRQEQSSHQLRLPVEYCFSVPVVGGSSLSCLHCHFRRFHLEDCNHCVNGSFRSRRGPPHDWG